MTRIKQTWYRAFIGLFTALVLTGCAVTKLDDVVILDGDVSFAFGSDQLTPAGKARLNQLADTIKVRVEPKVEITGHTDRIGDAKANMSLSQRRANSVRNQLLQNRLDPDHVVARGLGSKYPITKNCNQSNQQALIACLAPDRRVEIKISDSRW